MSSGFDAMANSDWAAILSSDGAFAEQVTYVPRNGDERVIYADIVRNPPARPDELQQGLTPSLVITVVNDATLGISAAELDCGGDAIKLKLNLGDATDTTILLPRADSQDSGTITFRVGKRK